MFKNPKFYSSERKNYPSGTGGRWFFLPLYSSGGNFTRGNPTISHKIWLENYSSEILFKYPREQLDNYTVILFQYGRFPECMIITYWRRLWALWKAECIYVYLLGYRYSGLGSNTFYQIQIQIQIQKFRFFKYKYKYFLQLWFKYKYKYKYIDSNTNTNTNTFNQIYLPKLVRIQIG